MSIVNSVLEQIEKGMKGENWGLPMGLPKLESVIDGVTQSTYSLIFGSTGSGKTSFALYAYIYKPLMDNINNENFKVIYYSLEMSAEALFVKLLSIYLWEKYGKELSFKELLSKKRGKTLSEEDFELVKDAKNWLDRIEEIITVYDRSLTADRMYAHLLKELGKYGRFEETDTRKIYIPNNKNQVILVVIDHIALMRKDKGRTKKEEIDLASNYLATLRNRCGISPLILMQMNRGSSSMDRRNAGFQEPQLDDIKDSGGPSEDAEIVLAVFHPHREKLVTYKDYKIKGMLENTFRAIIVLKNRYGDTDVSIGNGFYGNVGVWKELPRGKEINDYEPYLTLNGRPEQVKDEIIKKDTPVEIDNSEKNYQFVM